MENVSFEGKVAVVTGSSRGWGLAVAQELGKRGAKVVVNGTKEAGVIAAAESVKLLGADCVAVVESIASSAGACRIVAAAVENFDRLDILINNAGGFNGATILDMEEEQWNAVIDVQLNGVFHCTQHAARQMVSQGSGGAIINVCSALQASVACTDTQITQQQKRPSSPRREVGPLSCGRTIFA